VSLTELVPEGPVNTLFGDDLFVMGVDAPTSFALHRIEDPPGSGGVFVNADRTFTIDHPQTGLVRIGIQGDWTNSGRISAKLTIERVRRLLGRRAAEGRIAQDDVIPFVVDVPAGTSEAVFELAWLQNWGRYPTNDLDMLVLDPNMTVVEDAGGNPLGSNAVEPGARRGRQPCRWHVDGARQRLPCSRRRRRTVENGRQRSQGRVQPESHR